MTFQWAPGTKGLKPTTACRGYLTGRFLKELKSDFLLEHQ